MPLLGLAPPRGDFQRRNGAFPEGNASEKNATPEEKTAFSPWKRTFLPLASALPEG
jgi:hypothetical protein